MKLSQPTVVPLSSPLLRGLLALGAGAFLAPASGAAVLLVVDISNPAAITITATGAKPIANDPGPDGTWTFDGTTLLDFFTGDGGDLSAPLGAGSTLKPTGSIKTYNQWLTDVHTTDGVEYRDLNLYHGAFVKDPQNLDTAQPAFTGVATLNLASISAVLPAAGSTGPILAGYSGFPGPEIGEWAVVPEVSPGAQAAVFGLGAGALLFLRRRQRAA